MSVIVVGAGKGAPGVTTTAVALAAVWPHPVVLVECDPAGGDLPYLLTASSGDRLSPARGLVSLAATVRTEPHPDIAAHLQTLAGGLEVLAGPATRGQARALLPSLPSVIRCLRDSGTDVIVDCGQLSADLEVTGQLTAAADLTLVVARATVPSVAHTREALTDLGHPGDGRRPVATPVAVAVIGAAGQARQATAVLAAHSPQFLATLPDDPAGAKGLCGQWSRRLDRARLVVGARDLATQTDRALPERHTVVGTAAAGPADDAALPVGVAV